MNIEIQTTTDRVLVAIEGDLTLHEARALRRALLEPTSGPASVDIDLGRVPYIDSAGIATLFEAHRRSGRAGGRLVLVDPTAQVREVLRMMRLDTVFVIEGTGVGSSPGPPGGR